MERRYGLYLLLLMGLAPATARAQAAGEEKGDAKVYHLDPVVVTATRNAQALSTVPASMSVVGAAELKTRPVADLTDALRDLPGVSLTAASQGRRGIQIRGMDAKYTLILVDGKRIDSREAVFRHNDYDIGMIPVASIERIEVVRGGMSALYGSEALGGVINIITKKAAREWRGNVTSELQLPTEGDGGQEYRTNAYLSGALVPGRLGLTLSGGYNRRDVWRGWSAGPVLDAKDAIVTRPDGTVVDWHDLATLEGRSDHSARAKLSWTPAATQSLEAEYGVSRQTRFGEYYIMTWGEADAEIDRQDVVLTHRSTPAWGRTELRGYGEWVATGDGLEQANTVVEGSLGTERGRHELTLGGEARWTDLTAPAEFASGGAAVQQQAVYGQDQITLASSLRLLAGARLDHHENFGLHLTPRGYLVFAPSESWTLKGGIGTAFKAPTLRQLSGESVTPSCRGACVIVGNPSLAPETSVSYELSANYGAAGWSASLAAFENDIDNLIDTPRGTGVEPIGTDESGRPQYTPVNVNRARVRGLEATLRTELASTLRLSGNYTLLDARDLDADERLDYRPRHGANAQLDWDALPRTALFVRGQYIGEQTSGERVLDPYSLLDLGLTHRLGGQFSVRAGVLNLANTRTDSQADAYAFVERGRTAYVGLSAGF